MKYKYNSVESIVSIIQPHRIDLFNMRNRYIEDKRRLELSLSSSYSLIITKKEKEMIANEIFMLDNIISEFDKRISLF